MAADPHWRVVLDAMVWAQAAANSQGPSGEIVELARAGKFALIASTHIQVEVLDALADPYFRKRLGPEFDGNAWLGTTLLGCSEMVEAAGPTVLVDHAKDDPILWAAAAGDASHLVTWEPRLLNLKLYRFTQIVTPTAFLRECRSPRASEPVAIWSALRSATARPRARSRAARRASAAPTA